MNLAELKQLDSDLIMINKWLDHINETDQKCREEVIANCKENGEARAYYVKRYKQDCEVLSEQYWNK